MAPGAVVPSSVAFGELPGQRRPASVQKDVDRVFAALEPKASRWLCNGTHSLAYDLARFNEERFALELIERSPFGSELWFMDYGAGEFGWNAGMYRLLTQPGVYSKLEAKNIRFNLVGVRGERYGEVETETKSRVTNHYLGSIKIENLREALAAHGLQDVRFNYIAARWVLRHEVDPLGSWKECVDFLKVGGVFAFQGFFMAFPGQTLPDILEEQCVDNMLSVLVVIGGEWLWVDNQSGRNRGDGLLRKSILEPPFPFAYEDKHLPLGDKEAQVYSGVIQCYRSLVPLPTISREKFGEDTVLASTGSIESGFVEDWKRMGGSPKSQQKWRVVRAEQLPPT